MTHQVAGAISERLAQLDWQAIEQSLSEYGYAKTSPILTPEECAALIDLYPDPNSFRKHIDMERHQFGVGTYQYFAAPLPPLVQTLRTAAYPPLAKIANRWQHALDLPDPYPTSHKQFLRVCHNHGQTKPTPLLLRYEAGGYNCLHQDLYGAVAFPLQITCFLSRRERDYTGGEFLLVEQRPRAQSQGMAISTEQGEMLIFTTRERPVRGIRGYHRRYMRHGVSRVLTGSRYALGIIFHDAK